MIKATAKLDLTFSNVDLTNVRCQTVIIGPVHTYIHCAQYLHWISHVRVVCTQVTTGHKRNNRAIDTSQSIEVRF